MTPETQMSLSLIFAIIAVIGTILSIINSWRNNNEKETEKRLNIAEQFVGINLKLDTVCSSISELGKKNEASITEIQKINQSLVLENERIETLFKTQDDHEKRLKELESRRVTRNDEWN
jgi:chromosome segregation ATPase